VELLGDRILLSGATTIVVPEVPGEPAEADGSVRILIGLLEGGLELAKVQHEGLLAVSKLTDKLELKVDVLNKLSAELLDINDVFSKFGEALIKGELANKHFLEYGNKLETELDDLNKLTNELGPESAGLLLPAVQAARETFKELSEYKLGDMLKWQDAKSLLSVSDVFGKMDDLLLKSTVDALTGGFKGESPSPQFKFQELVNKATEYLNKVDDPAMYNLLLPAVQRVASQYQALLTGGDTVPNPELTFTGGLSVLDQTDDLISEA
jgi:hypothetical protein